MLNFLLYFLIYILSALRIGTTLTKCSRCDSENRKNEGRDDYVFMQSMCQKRCLFDVSFLSPYLPLSYNNEGGSEEELALNILLCFEYSNKRTHP